MKVTVTHTKAPWPEGVKLGDVVEVGDSMPGCFVGKCSPAEDKAKAAHTYKPAPPVQPQAAPGVAVVEAAGNAAEELEIARNQLQAAEQASNEMASLLEASRKEAGDALNEAAVLKAERDRVIDELAAANKRIAEIEHAAAAKPKK